MKNSVAISVASFTSLDPSPDSVYSQVGDYSKDYLHALEDVGWKGWLQVDISNTSNLALDIYPTHWGNYQNFVSYVAESYVTGNITTEQKNFKITGITDSNNEEIKWPLQLNSGGDSTLRIQVIREKPLSGYDPNKSQLLGMRGVFWLPFLVNKDNETKLWTQIVTKSTTS